MEVRHMIRNRLFIGFFLSALVLIGCEKGNESATPKPTPAPAAGQKLKIAVIPKGTSHSFWKSVEAGVRKAESELGITAIWKGPLKEDDRAEQIKVVDQFISEGVNGIVLAPLDDTALLRPVRNSVARNIPVVIFDSGLKGDVGKDFVSFVATDNRQGGKMGGDELARLLGGKGKVVLLRYSEGSASTDEREAGFLEAMAANPGIQIIVKDVYGGATAAEAQDEALKLIDRLRECDGIFCPNESSTQGMLNALRKADLAGKKKFVGFDASPPLIDGLNKSEIDALVSQNPVKMGYEGVKTMVAHIKGEKVPPRVDTGVKLITRENLSDPEVKQLIGSQ
jgi:ribose transport system substrate-binding protein